MSNTKPREKFKAESKSGSNHANNGSFESSSDSTVPRKRVGTSGRRSVGSEVLADTCKKNNLWTTIRSIVALAYVRWNLRLQNTDSVSDATYVRLFILT